ncbi:MAG: hypothetical protein M0036_12845 [Desulfobacteraceae bacterium]|nr:hypothetical protein [Desulfobacteraceae bacterium]
MNNDHGADMTVSSDAIRAAVGSIWPDLKYIVLSDPDYIRPTMEELSQTLNALEVQRMPYIPLLFECEEFALGLMYEVRKQHAQEAIAGRIAADRLLNWPLGICAGTRFRGRDLDHWANVCLTTDGVRLIEPQNNTVWAPDAQNDQIYFLLM